MKPATVRELLYHALSDRGRPNFDYDRLVVVDQGERGYDVVLRIDGGYAHPADADAARINWQEPLNAVLAEIEREAIA
jgi:hypothetical protein